jgi:arabinofuranosyltransferase
VTTPPRPTPRVPIALFIGSLSAIVLIVHARSYLPLVVDDAYISLRYAMRFLHGQGLTWSDGEAVEGYSNLLWVLSCAALGGLGLDLVDATRVLGLLSGILTMAAFLYAFPPRNWAGSLPSLASTLFIALAGPIAIWSIAGLEACMVAALLAWGLVLLQPLLDGAEAGPRTVLLPGIPLALLCLTRPDTPLLVLTICAFLLVQAKSLRDGLIAAFGVGALPALATLGQTAFRLTYYGDWLPNTARAKVAFTDRRLQTGMQCVSDAWLSSYALWILAAVALYVAWRDRTRRSRILLATTLLLVWTGYTAAITCWKFGYRMLIPWFVLLPYLVAEALDWTNGQGRKVRMAAWGGVLAALLAFGWTQHHDRNIAHGRVLGRAHGGKGATIGTALRRAFTQQDPLVAVDAAGAIPYYSQLRSLDMLGLNDAHIARRRTAQFGKGLQGHELGDGNYVLEREPDIVIGGILGGPRLSYVGGMEMEADPRFTDWYRLVTLHADDPVPLSFGIFIRLEGRVGLERSDAEIRIPGYLFASTEGAEARFDSSGTLATVFAETLSAELKNVELPAGVWRLATTGSVPFALSVRRQSDGKSFSSEEGSLEFAVDEPGPVDLTVVGDPKSRLVEVVAHRSPG